MTSVPKGMVGTRQLEHVFRIYVYPGLVWTGRNLPKSSPTLSDEREIFRELNYANKSNDGQGNICIVEVFVQPVFILICIAPLGYIAAKSLLVRFTSINVINEFLCKIVK